MPIIRSLLTTLACTSCLLSASVFAEMRDRVQIVNQNVVTDTGQPLRGAPFFLDIFSIQDEGGMKDKEAEFRSYFRKVSTEYNINAVRIAPWIGRWTYMQKDDQYYESHVDQISYMIDTVVRWAEEDGIYAIINLHSRFGSDADLDRMKDFWDLFAAPYADKTHVVFELTNEPKTRLWVDGDDHYVEGADQSNTLIQEAMEPLYHHVRALAPDTHFILWSPYLPTALPVSEIQAHSGSIDYSNASIGFHIYEYNLDKKTEWDAAQAYRDAGYATIVTEFYSLTSADYYPIDYNHLITNLKTAEDYGFSWVQWSPTANYNNVNQGLTNADIGFSQLYKDYISQNMYGVFDNTGEDLRDSNGTSYITDAQGRTQDGTLILTNETEVRLVNDAKPYWNADNGAGGSSGGTTTNPTPTPSPTPSPTPTPDTTGDFIFSSFEDNDPQRRGGGEGEIVIGAGFATNGVSSLRTEAVNGQTLLKMVDYTLTQNVADRFVSGKLLELDVTFDGTAGDYTNIILAYFDVALNKFVQFDKLDIQSPMSKKLMWSLDKPSTSSDPVVAGKSLATLIGEANGDKKVEFFLDKASDSEGFVCRTCLSQLNLSESGSASPRSASLRAL